MGDDMVDQGPNNVVDVVTWTTLFLFAFFYWIIEIFYDGGDNFLYAFAIFLIYSIISSRRCLNQFELDRLNVINTSVILTFFISAIILMPVDGFPPTGVLCIPILGPILVVMTPTFAKEEWSQTERKYFIQGSLLSLPFSITSLLLYWEMTDYVSIF